MKNPHFANKSPKDHPELQYLTLATPRGEGKGNKKQYEYYIFSYLQKIRTN